jgi:hypothetical protein
MFLPQVITAVGSSLLQGDLSRRLGGKPEYLAGLCANLAAIILLIASCFVMGSQAVACPLPLVALGVAVARARTPPPVAPVPASPAAAHEDTAACSGTH